jgi:hypothetical protein
MPQDDRARGGANASLDAMTRSGPSQPVEEPAEDDA